MPWVAVSSPDIQPLRNQPQGICQITAGPKTLCLAKQGERWFAISPKCPHQGAPLVGGHFNQSGELVCPWHRFTFDLATGQSNSGGYFVETYALRGEGDQLWVELPQKPWWQFW